MADWEERLAKSGCRITAPRRAIIHVLLSATTPLQPQEVLAAAQDLHASIGLVTVYRTLNLLTELNLVRRVHREDGCHGYMRASPGHHHAVICVKCGAAVEFSGEDDLSRLAARVQDRTGFRVDDHLLQLYGVCPDCRQE